MEPDSQAKKHDSTRDGLLGEVFGDRKERTLTGCVIGTVRDTFSGDLTEEQKTKRAESNDFMATIAADTVAMLSKRAGVGGIVRATMLADTHGDIKDVGLNFVKDGLEGYALNKIGKIGMPRGEAVPGAHFTRGFKAEAKLHAGSGALFGLVKAAGDPYAWRDADGHFSFKNGIRNLTDKEKMIKATAFGAVANVPAGFLGTRLAGAATIKIAERTGMARLGMVGGGVVSGAGSGGVFGGIDTAVRGGSFSDILQGTKDGMLVGAFTGGAITGYHSIKGGPELARSLNLGKEPVQERMAVMTESGDVVLASTDKRGRVTLEPWHSESPRMTKIFEAVEFVPPEREPISGLSRLLTRDRVETMSFTRLKDPTQKSIKAKDWTEFLKHTKQVQEEVVVYKVDGLDIEIIVPLSYARKLDAVRQLRAVAETDIPIFDNLPSQDRINLSQSLRSGNHDVLMQAFGPEFENVARVLKARVAITADPFNQRALPEDMIPPVRDLPNQKLLKKLYLVDEDYYGDAHDLHKYKNHAGAAATAGEDGSITFYKPMNGDVYKTAHGMKLREYTSHEWAHLVKFALSEHSRLFNMSVDLRPKDGWVARPYARKQYPDQPQLKDHEYFAVHLGENLIMPDGEAFLLTAQKTPVPTVMMARAWLESMIPQSGERVIHPAEWAARINAIPEQVPYREAYIARLKYIAEDIVPVARQELVEVLGTGKAADRRMAAELLGHIGSKDDVAALYKLARTSSDADVRQTAYDAAVKLTSPEPATQFDFIVATAKPDSTVRDLAIAALNKSKDPRARQFKHFFLLAGDAKNIPEIIKYIDWMTDAKARQMAFDEVIRLGTRDVYGREFALSFAQETAARHPDLRMKALDVIAGNLDASSEATLRRLKSSRDREVRERSVELHKELQVRTEIEKYRGWLRGSDEGYKREAVDKLAYLGDHRAIPPLLEVVAGHDARWGRYALEALKHYAPNTVASYARTMQGNGSFPLTWDQLRRQLSMNDAPLSLVAAQSSSIGRRRYGL